AAAPTNRRRSTGRRKPSPRRSLPDRAEVAEVIAQVGAPAAEAAFASVRAAVGTALPAAAISVMASRPAFKDGGAEEVGQAYCRLCRVRPAHHLQGNALSIESCTSAADGKLSMSFGRTLALDKITSTKSLFSRPS